MWIRWHLLKHTFLFFLICNNEVIPQNTRVSAQINLIGPLQYPNHNPFITLQTGQTKGENIATFSSTFHWCNFWTTSKIYGISLYKIKIKYTFSDDSLWDSFRQDSLFTQMLQTLLLNSIQFNWRPNSGNCEHLIPKSHHHYFYFSWWKGLNAFRKGLIFMEYIGIKILRHLEHVPMFKFLQTWRTQNPAT